MLLDHNQVNRFPLKHIQWTLITFWNTSLTEHYVLKYVLMAFIFSISLHIEQTYCKQNILCIIIFFINCQLYSSKLNKERWLGNNEVGTKDLLNVCILIQQLKNVFLWTLM